MILTLEAYYDDLKQIHVHTGRAILRVTAHWTVRDALIVRYESYRRFPAVATGHGRFAVCGPSLEEARQSPDVVNYYAAGGRLVAQRRRDLLALSTCG